MRRRGTLLTRGCISARSRACSAIPNRARSTGRADDGSGRRPGNIERTYRHERQEQPTTLGTLAPVVASRWPRPREPRASCNTGGRLWRVDGVNTFRVSAGHLASFRVLSRSESRHLRRSDQFTRLVRFPAAPPEGPQIRLVSRSRTCRRRFQARASLRYYPKLAVPLRRRQFKSNM
jgi:hypothetical protein